MQTLQDMMRNFLDGHMDVDDFVAQYMQGWRQVREEQNAALEAQGLSGALRDLTHRLSGGHLNTEAYQQQWEALVAQVSGLSVPIGSPADRILSHLFVETSSYVGDPELREPYELDEAQLRAEVEKAYAEWMG
jgi:hypothetical protein